MAGRVRENVAFDEKETVCCDVPDRRDSLWATASDRVKFTVGLRVRLALSEMVCDRAKGVWVPLREALKDIETLCD